MTTFANQLGFDGIELVYENGAQDLSCHTDNEYIQASHVRIVGVQYDSDHDIELRYILGRAVCHVFQAGRAADNGGDIWGEADGEDGDLEAVASLILKRAFQEHFELFGYDFLYIHSIRLKKKYRGKGLGLMVLSRLLDRFDHGLTAAIIRPAPLTKFPNTTKEDGTRKLRSHWGKAGFVPYQSSPFLVYDFARKRVDVEKLVTQKVA
jgi:GNAT superfamily N-acetyltransferase